MPISAPRPSWPPSLNRVLALTMTAELSTSATNSLGGREIAGDDRLGVARAVAGDVGDRLVERFDDGDGQDLVEILGIPVGRLGGLHGRDEVACDAASPRSSTPSRSRASAALGRKYGAIA